MSPSEIGFMKAKLVGPASVIQLKMAGNRGQPGARADPARTCCAHLGHRAVLRAGPEVLRMRYSRVYLLGNTLEDG